MPSVIPLTSANIARTTRFLTDAFFNDPMSVYYFPDEAQRRQHLGVMLTSWVRYAVHYGEAFTTEAIDGVAVWLKPDQNDFTFWRILRTGLIFTPLLVGRDAFQRMMTMVEALEPYHERTAPKAHWNLMLLGVAPARQRQGIGAELVQPILQRADGHGQACYLETQNPANLSFYRKLGFEVAAEVAPPNGAPLNWIMMRHSMANP